MPEDRKYNVGDRVIEVECLEYLSNQYHYEKALNSIQTVKSANDRLFSVYRVDKFTCIAGVDRYQFNFQENGNSMLRGSTRLHVEKDREQILSIITKVCEDATKDIQAGRATKAERLRKQISRLQKELAELQEEDCEKLTDLNNRRDVLLQSLKGSE